MHGARAVSVRIGVACALVALCVLSASQVASQAPVAQDTAAGVPAATDSEEYSQAVDEAVREFAAGRFEEARALFKRAHEISPNARTLRGLGMTAFELRFYVQATRDLSAALADTRKPLAGSLRTQAQALLDRARSFTGAIRLEVEPQSATVLIDGRPLVREPNGVILFDPGTHVVAATAEGFKSTNIRVVVESGTEQNVRLAMEPLVMAKAGIAPIDAERMAAEPPRAAPAQTAPATRKPSTEGSSLAPWAYGTLIGAGAFGAGAAIFWFVGDSKYGDLEDECGTSCSDQQVDDSGVKTTDLLTNVCLGVSIASAVASAVLFAVDAGSSSDDRAVLRSRPLALRAQVSGGTTVLSGSF